MVHSWRVTALQSGLAGLLVSAVITAPVIAQAEPGKRPRASDGPPTTGRRC